MTAATPKPIWRFGWRGWVALAILAGLFAFFMLTPEWEVRCFELAHWSFGDRGLGLLTAWSFILSGDWMSTFPEIPHGWPVTRFGPEAAIVLVIAMTLHPRAPKWPRLSILAWSIVAYPVLFELAPLNTGKLYYASIPYSALSIVLVALCVRGWRARLAVGLLVAVGWFNSELWSLFGWSTKSWPPGLQSFRAVLSVAYIPLWMVTLSVWCFFGRRIKHEYQCPAAATASAASTPASAPSAASRPRKSAPDRPPLRAR